MYHGQKKAIHKKLLKSLDSIKGSRYGLVVNVFDCVIVISEFELHLGFGVHF